MIGDCMSFVSPIVRQLSRIFAGLRFGLFDFYRFEAMQCKNVAH